MAADFNKPNASSKIVEVMSEIRQNESALAKQFKGVAVENIPLDAIRYDAGIHYRWDGSNWVTELSQISGGGTGASSASGARSNLSVYSKSEVDGYINGVSTTISNHSGRTDNPHEVVASQIGLGNVANYSISDVISNNSSQYASSAAVYSHSSRTDNPHEVTADDLDLGNVTNESKSTMFNDPVFTGTVSGVSKAMVGLGNVNNYGISDSIILEDSATYASSKAVNDSNIVFEDISGMPTAPESTLGNVDSISWKFLRKKESKTTSGDTIRAYNGGVSLSFTSNSPSTFYAEIDLSGFIEYDIGRGSKVFTSITSRDINDYNLSIDFSNTSTVLLRGAFVGSSALWSSLTVHFSLEDIF